jgi:transposase-like protein
MIKKVTSASLFTASIALLCAAVNAQQFPIMDKIADKVIQKYQTSTCEQLWEERAQKGKAPKPQMEQEALQMVKSDLPMRSAFINKVAAPIANKMFECGMIP